MRAMIRTTDTTRTTTRTTCTRQQRERCCKNRQRQW